MDRWFLNNRFLVLFGGIRYGFSKISNLTSEMEYDSVTEGGRNWGPHLFRKPAGKCDTMTFERGRKVIPSILSPTLSVGTQVEMVIIMVRSGLLFRCYGFDQGVVTKLTLSDLDAMGHEILIERMEIAHSGLYKVQLDNIGEFAKIR